MSSTRSFIANAEKVEESLTRAREQKDCRDSLRILEALQTDPEIKDFLSSSDTQQSKVQKAYRDLLRTFATELYQVSQYTAGKLDKLENVKIDEESPASHTNASIAFTNLSHYLVDDILSEPNAAMRVLILKRWLKILDISMNLGDFHSAAAIHAGMNDAALGRLKTIFMHLNADEKALMEHMNETFLRDQGWKLMSERLESGDRNYFIPSLAAIKKAMTKAKEARQTHSMHSAFLESQGKLTRSASPSTSNTAQPDTLKKSPKKTTLELLTELIATLNASSRITSPQQLSGLQRDLLALNSDQPHITIKPIRHDEHVCYAHASEMEREELPNVLSTLQAELHKTLSLLLTKKKLVEPLKSLKKKLRDFPMETMLAARFGFTEQCSTLKSILTELTPQQDAQSKTPRTPRLARANTKSRLTPVNDTLPDFHSILTMVTQIDEFTKRHERLMRESTASNASLIGSVSSGLSSAATSDSGSRISLRSSGSGSQLSIRSGDDDISEPTSSSSSVATPSFSDADTRTASDAAQHEALQPMKKRDVAIERGLFRQASMSLAPRKSSLATLKGGTPQPSPKASPHGSPGSNKRTPK